MNDSSGIRKFFEKNWEKMTLWAILVGLFYLLKPFFLLIFGTFLITSITKAVVDTLIRRWKLNYRFTTAMVFVLFVALLWQIGSWIGPRIVVQTHEILVEFAVESEQQAGQKIDRYVENVVTKIIGDERTEAFIGSEEYATMLSALKIEAKKAASTVLPHVLEIVVKLIKLGWQLLISLLLAIIFSFILVMDWRKIVRKMKDLESSGIRTFYIGAAPHLIAFADILAKALRAQAIIATCNTILTAAGLWFFDVPSIALLSTIVFLCGFVPILGTFMSSIPILLFGLQAGGLSLTLNLIILIAIIHAFEAYILNPRITANVLHAHPLLVLVLLLLGERFFGVWGMIVGVPIGYYVISVLTTKETGAQTPSGKETPV